MNALEKILTPVFAAINGIFDKINPRTSNMIRQGYIFLIVAMCIIGAIIGFTSGRKSAKKTGIQMADTTNQIFDLDIQQAQTEGRFGALLESESDRELDKRDALKEKAPGRETAIADDSSTIIEPERDRHIKTTPDAAERNDLPPVPRLDESDPFIDDIKRAEPKHAEKVRADVSGLNEKSVIEKKAATDTQKKEQPLKKSDDIRGPVKPQTKEPQIKPMQKKEAVAE
jgi:hypothetical protein